MSAHCLVQEYHAAAAYEAQILAMEQELYGVRVQMAVGMTF